MRKLLIIGGTAVRQNYDGSIKIKFPFKLYLEEISNYFNEVIWLTTNKIEAPVDAEIQKCNIKIIPYNSSFLSCLKTSIFLINFFFRNKSYLLLFPSPKLHFVVPLITKLSLKSVYYLGINPNNIKSKKLIKFFSLKFLHILPLKFVDQVIVRGEFLRKSVISYNKNIEKTIPISYQFKPDNTKFKKNDYTIIYIGKILEEKGVFDLYDAIRRININKKIKLKLEYVGDGKSLNRLKSLVNSHKSKFVKFHGWVNKPKKMDELLRSASLLVCPSRSNYPEGVPRVINESLDCKTPVLCSDQITFVEEFINGEVFFFESGNINDLTDKISYFFKNKLFRNQLIKNILIYHENKKSLTAGKQHAEILLNNRNLKEIPIKYLRYNGRKIVFNSFERSLSSHRNLSYIKNRIIEIFYRFFYKDKPWLTPKANDILKTLIKKDHVGFEFGSGNSTIWFAKNCRKIYSVETSLFWKNKILDMARNEKLTNINIDVVKENSINFAKDYINKITKFEDESLDFVLIDGKLRDLSTLNAISKIKSGGILIIDNFQRYLPSKSTSPFAIGIDEKPLNNIWYKIQSKYLNKWKSILTSNGINDTAIFFKP